MPLCSPISLCFEARSVLSRHLRKDIILITVSNPPSALLPMIYLARCILEIDAGEVSPSAIIPSSAKINLSCANFKRAFARLKLCRSGGIATIGPVNEMDMIGLDVRRHVTGKMRASLTMNSSQAYPG